MQLYQNNFSLYFLSSTASLYDCENEEVIGMSRVIFEGKEEDPCNHDCYDILENNDVMCLCCGRIIDNLNEEHPDQEEDLEQEANRNFYESLAECFEGE